QSSASKGLLDPAKVGGLALRKAVSLSLKVCSRGCLFTRALASVSSMRVWLWIICARSVKGGGGGGSGASSFSPLPWLTSCSTGGGFCSRGGAPASAAGGIRLREALVTLRETICRSSGLGLRLGDV